VYVIHANIYVEKGFVIFTRRSSKSEGGRAIREQIGVD